MTPEHEPDPRREYRFTGGTGAFWAGLVPLAAAAFGLVYDMSTDDVPVAVPVATGAFFAALLGFVAFLIARAPTAVTLCDEQGLTARSVFRTRTTAWRDVQGIEVDEPPSGQIAAEGTPRRFAVVYDAAGERYTLPQLDDRRCQGGLDHEVADLRRVWQRYRGADWAPVPEVQDRIAHRRQVNARVSLWLIIFVTAILAFVLGLALCMGLLVAGVYPQIGDPDPGFFVGTLLHPAALMGGLPAVATAVAVAVTLHLRRR
ncbi:hypothetical protein DVA86_17105 [Streptomyces armeniacus]|uniref:Low molecular weight protein antigen 6 PH domain-containing protein n=1 Tax=Streptomyces armeniacus TaxID=83291 RepID=A0A345XR53_9ACTN|nr:PH domain-containing protein [Streptomyces armeniacus]AXK34119.1 hypothetical protein DVA86_17105 [Streptomyces armeniacus]